MQAFLRPSFAHAMINETDELDAIDAVVTWVDGSDEMHVQKRTEALKKESLLSVNSIPGGKARTRFADSGEIFHCLRLIRKNCPWIRIIYLVTDDQTPDFLTDRYRERNRIVVIDHRDVFKGYEWALPTFNSQAIETVIHRIDGLADKFIYFNDDVFVLKFTPSSEFFQHQKVVLRGDWAKMERFGFFRKLASSVANHVADKFGVVRSMAVLAQYRAAKMAGFDRKLLLAPHSPHPVRKSTLLKYFSNHVDELEENIRHRFRNMEQFVPIPLANHLELSNDGAVVSSAKDYMIIFINRDDADAIERKMRMVEERPPRFLCVQGLELADERLRARIENVLKNSAELM